VSATGAVRIRIAVARGAPAQQQALDVWLADTGVDAGPRAVLVESVFTPLAVPAGVALERLAPGCVCCVGQVPLRVALTRLLRAVRPRRVLLLLASGEHLPRLCRQLAGGELGVPVQLETDPSMPPAS
jgi:hypothetical protein